MSRDRRKLSRWWRSARGLWLVRLACGRLLRGVGADFRLNVLDPVAASARRAGIPVSQKNLPVPAATPQSAAGRPSIYVSYAVDENFRGSHRYCGGEKCLNNLVLLLRRKGYDAFMVSFDGKNAGWLAEHAPFLSLEEFTRRRAVEPEARCVTSWLEGEAFLARCGQFYFWDMELGTSADYQFAHLCRERASGALVKTAGFNRAIQAWHQTTFDEPCPLLLPLVDETHWRPDPTRRVPLRFGYFDEGPHTADLVGRIVSAAAMRDIALEAFALHGDEPDVIAQMQTCTVFVTANVGKSAIWGEGGPLGPFEAIACGCVPVAFDLNGPREAIADGFNGLVIPRYRFDLMVANVAELFANPARLAAMQSASESLHQKAHTMETRWLMVRDFLDLEE